jgi:hypothetical protein
MRSAKMFTLKVVLLGAMAVPMLFVSAYGQQEVDPTWYDPWASPSKPVAQTVVKADPKPAKKANSTTLASGKNKPKARQQAASAHEQTQIAATNDQTRIATK